MNGIDLFLEYSGIIAIIITSISTYVVQRNLNIGNKKDILLAEYRNKKQGALDELNDIMILNNIKPKIIISPVKDCPVNPINYNDVIIKTTNPVLEDISLTEEMAERLFEFCSKNNCWMDSSVLKHITLYISFLNNYIYYCKTGVLVPNKLTATLLREDLFDLVGNINKSVTNSYFTSLRKKKLIKLSYKNKLFRLIFYYHTNKYKIVELVALAKALSEDESISDNCKDNSSDLLFHANSCKNCNLKCELAGLYFTEFNQRKIVN